MNNSIDLLKLLVGRDYLTEVDPYWNTPGGWSENARGDGATYAGVVKTLHRLDGESDQEFERRAIERANQLP